MSVKKTPLNRIHREMGGRMVEFAGWEMPVQYKSAVEEHHAVRKAVGVFDVSHMGQLEIVGPDAEQMVRSVTCNDVGRLQDGQAQYSAFLTPAGTFVDDIVVYRFNAERFFICVNAGTTQKDFDWVVQNQAGNVEISNLSDQYAQIAVQGPLAEATVQALTETDLSGIKFYWFTEGQVAGKPGIISRTGYTGEPGFELYVSTEDAEHVWTRVFEAGKPHGIKAAGLAARNSLRLEMRYPLYGNDIDENRTPLEAGLGWIVKFNAPFIGRESLEKQKESGVTRKLVGFTMVDAGIARDGYSAHLEDGSTGEVTSGGFSPSLGKSIGLVYLPAQSAVVGCEFMVDIRGKLRKAEVVKTPFYTPS
ncbi:MAG: glycine cleavage system aminomethyltransferase GcvT [Acidobacteriota bacterium]|nr:MAG: glycine cleavage system aminomethyltransferase GcvT [Acidobacteriota bacterium]